MDDLCSTSQQLAGLRSILCVTVFTSGAQHYTCRCLRRLRKRRREQILGQQTWSPQGHRLACGPKANRTFARWQRSRDLGVTRDSTWREKKSRGLRVVGVCTGVHGSKKVAAEPPLGPTRGPGLLGLLLFFPHLQESCQINRAKAFGSGGKYVRKGRKSRPWMESNKQRVLRRSKNKKGRARGGKVVTGWSLPYYVRRNAVSKPDRILSFFQDF